MTSSAPKVGIIYLTFATPNWQRDIGRAMSSLEHVTYPKDRVEIICVESRAPNGERVKEWFEHEWMPKSGNTLPNITYIHKDEMIGFAGNNNLGYEKARELGCDYVYLLNEDTEVDPDFLTRAVERAEQDPKVAYVQSLILLGHDKNKVNTIGNAFHFLGFGYSNGYLWTREQAEKFFETERRCNPDLEIGYASGAGMLGRVSAIEKCGGLFDARFFSYHEDTDATLQARVRGYKTVVEPGSIIYHYYEFEKSQLKKNYWIERNRLVLILSFYQSWTLFLLAPAFILMELALIAFSIKGGWWQEKSRAYREMMTADYWRWIKERRKKIQYERTVSDRDLLSRAVATIEFQGDTFKNPLLTYVGNPFLRVYWWAAKRLI